MNRDQFSILKNTILNPLGFCTYRRIFRLGKDLLARLYLKAKCMFDCIFEDSSKLKNLPLLNIELTLILQFCFLDDLFKLCFLTKCLFFHHN